MIRRYTLCIRSLPRSESGRWCWRLLLLSNWLDASGPHRAASSHLCWARFFTILHTAWFLSSFLDFAWYLGSSLVLLESCLWCWSWDQHVAFIQVMFCTLLNYKTITCKFISLIWSCWTSNTKIQSKWAYDPFSLQAHLVDCVANN